MPGHRQGVSEIRNLNGLYRQIEQIMINKPIPDAVSAVHVDNLGCFFQQPLKLFLCVPPCASVVIKKVKFAEYVARYCKNLIQCESHLKLLRWALCGAVYFN